MEEGSWVLELRVSKSIAMMHKDSEPVQVDDFVLRLQVKSKGCKVPARPVVVIAGDIGSVASSSCMIGGERI